MLVTHKRLPQVKHYGDVSKIKGAELEPVDIITFGSPCQDMSIAGRRAGLDGERSGLFHQAIRIIKGMREASAICAEVKQRQTGSASFRAVARISAIREKERPSMSAPRGRK